MRPEVAVGETVTLVLALGAMREVLALSVTVGEEDTLRVADELTDIDGELVDDADDDGESVSVREGEGDGDADTESVAESEGDGDEVVLGAMQHAGRIVLHCASISSLELNRKQLSLPSILRG